MPDCHCKKCQGRRRAYERTRRRRPEIKERIKRYQQTYYQRPEVKERDRRWRWKMHSKSRRGGAAQVRVAILAFFDSACVRCGFSDTRALQIDHVQGDGFRERRAASIDFYLKVLTSLQHGEQRYQVLCANCNWIKRDEDVTLAQMWKASTVPLEPQRGPN